MKKWIMILALVLFLGANFTPAIAGNGGPGAGSLLPQCIITVGFYYLLIL